MVEEGVLVEITNLLVPTLNDDEENIRRMCVWIARTLGEDIPVHFSRFHPTYQLRGLPPTPVATLERAAEVASQEGLKYVYIGNVPGGRLESTWCPSCGGVLVRRLGYRVLELNIDGGGCKFCGEAIPGIWGS
jgi:pyruvate formate lyase activating enzyme